MRRPVALLVLGAAACANEATAITDPSDAGDVGDRVDRVDASPDAAAIVATTDADAPEWARYTIAPGAHAATLTDAAAGHPLAGLVKGVSARAYRFAFDSSAAYVIANPVEPNDQLDWNKLPGLSDCNGVDLAKDGVMFGWRWRVDTSPNVLEITAYANQAGVHETAASPLLTLDAADLASETPLRYRIAMDGALYRFAIDGIVRGREIAAMTTLPRRCATTEPATLTIQWAAGLYFGGTSTAPSTITGRISE